MNQDPIASGLARVQSESHIPANTWRQWCIRLDIDPALAIEVWDDVCHPMMLASGKAPDLALILQLRAARPDIYIDDFRDELPAVLLSTTLVDALRSEGKGPARGALLQLYRHLAVRTGEPVGRLFVAHTGSLALLEAVLPEDLTLPKLIKVLCAGKGALADLCRLGRRSLTDDARGTAVGEALDAALALLNPAAAAREREPSEAAAEVSELDADPDRDTEDDEEKIDDEEIDDDDEVSSHEGERTESGDESDDEDEPDTPARPLGPEERYLDALRIALAMTCADETIADPAERATRLQSIQAFNPLDARIPSMEEARQMNVHAQPAGEGRRRALESGGRAASRITSAGGGRPSGRSSAPPSSGGGRSTITIIRGGGTSAARSTGSASTGGITGGEGTRADGSQADRSQADGSQADGSQAAGSQAAGSTAPVPNAEGKLPAPMIARRELDQAVQSVAAGLNQARELDARVWLLFADPELELEDPCALAQDLVTEDSAGERAGAALRLAAQQQRVRSLLDLPPDRRLNGRRFDLEAEAWLNTVANYHRSYDPDSRQLISLPKVLDCAAGALVRIEALRAAIETARDTESEQVATIEVVAQRYELLLSDITYLADAATITAARARADADASTVLAAAVAEAWIEQVRATALDWVGTVVDAGACASVDALKAALDSTPLSLEAPGEGESVGAAPGNLPDKLAADTALGEIVDTLRVHVLQAAWNVLREPHRPQETAEQLDLDLRCLLRAHARITLRRERHQKNPRIALPVASLERLSGNVALKNLFVRLTTDGKLMFLEDYEDGSFIDVFALLENQKRQMHARARDRARDDHTGELQTGSSYLHTVCRTNNPFARTEREVLAACVVDDDGEPVIFDPF